MVDALINQDGLVTPWELLQLSVDADGDYARLEIEKGWTSRINPYRMGFMPEVVVDPNALSSSGGILAGPSRAGGCIVPPVVPSASPLPPNVIARRR